MKPNFNTSSFNIGLFTLRAGRSHSFLSWGPGHSPAASKVKMDVKDFLTGISGRVENDPVPFFIDPQVPGDLAGPEQDMPENVLFFFWNVIEGCKMFLGNNQDVDRGLRIDVIEGDNTIVFEYQLGRNLIVNDLAKNAILHFHSFCR